MTLCRDQTSHMTIVEKLLLLAIAGSLGALARYGLTGVVQRWSGSAFPWGTMAANILGCFAFGILWALAVERMAMSPEVRVILLTGFLGSFTTFATFMSETYQLMAAAQYLAAMGNLLLTTLSGLGVFLLGLAVGRVV
jgi:CrcB protein